MNSVLRISYSPLIHCWCCSACITSIYYRQWFTKTGVSAEAGAWSHFVSSQNSSLWRHAILYLVRESYDKTPHLNWMSNDDQVPYLRTENTKFAIDWKKNHMNSIVQNRSVDIKNSVYIFKWQIIRPLRSIHWSTSVQEMGCYPTKSNHYLRQ